MNCQVTPYLTRAKKPVGHRVQNLNFRILTECPNGRVLTIPEGHQAQHLDSLFRSIFIPILPKFPILTGHANTLLRRNLIIEGKNAVDTYLHTYPTNYRDHSLHSTGTVYYLSFSDYDGQTMLRNIRLRTTPSARPALYVTTQLYVTTDGTDSTLAYLRELF